MVVNKRKKNSRHRGSWTHGWGEKKKHRGAGSRGGRGMAGTGKRADTNKPSIQEDPQYFGKFGFYRPGAHEKINALNVQTIQSNLATLGAEKKGTAYVVDLTKTKYNKLLASGDISVAVQVTVKYASATAIEKIKAAGGSVTTTAKVEPKKEVKADAKAPAKASAPVKKK